VTLTVVGTRSPGPAARAPGATSTTPARTNARTAARSRIAECLWSGRGMVRTAALLVTEHLSLGVVAAGTLAHQVIGRPSARKTCRSEGPLAPRIDHDTTPVVDDVRTLAVTPLWCHSEAMDLTTYI